MENQSQSNKQYKPISSDFYDELEAAATTNQICEIIYQDDNGKETKVISLIKDLYTENGVEYARLENQIIRLDSIINLNGKSDGSNQVDLDLLQKDMLPADGSESSHETSAHVFTSDLTSVIATSTDSIEHGDRSMGLANTEEEIADKRFVGDFSQTSGAAMASDRVDSLVQGDIHQHESIEDNLLATTQVSGSEYPVQKEDESDFSHRFTTATIPFLIAENEYYNLTFDRMRNRLYLTVFKYWDEPGDVMEMGSYFSRIAPLMTDTFTLLNDLTALQPDESGTLMAPALPNKTVLLNAGLVKVADLVPYDCDTLVHGLHAFSVNSLRVRYFKDRAQAEHWLGDDYRETGTPEDIDLN